MRGFRHRTTIKTALEWVDQNSQVLAPEVVARSAANGRVLADEVASDVNVPSFRRAMMDGFAVQAVDTFGATSYNPLSLSIVGEILPGGDSHQEVHRGEAIGIMTGAPMPLRADAVIPAEKASRQKDKLSVFDEVPPERHVGKIGEDIQQGDTVLKPFRRLRPQDLGVLSSIGKAEVRVVRQPRVRLVITGDELCAAGSFPKQNQTVDANSPMLSALIQRDGGELLFDAITPDRPELIREMMLDPDADIVVVSGGSSVGQEDHAPRLLSEIGKLAIHGVAMRPSSPAGMGCIHHRPVFLLPGNPVSCLCAYDFFAGRAIRLRGGRSADWPYQKQTGMLVRKISSVVGRQDYARVTIRGGQVVPIAIGGASVLSSTSRADGFVIIPTDSEGFPPGTDVEVLLYG